MSLHDPDLLTASQSLKTNPEKALQLASTVVARNPSPQGFRIVAAALRALNRGDEAERAEMEAVRHGFSNELRQARAAQQARRSEEALAIAEEHLKENPDDLLGMTIRAEALVALGRSTDAAPILREVVARAPTFPPANLLLAGALGNDLRLNDAAEVLQRFIARAPHEANAKRLLGDLRAQQNDPAKAAALYGEVVAANPDNPADLFKHAQNLRAAGNKEESVSSLRRAISAAPLSGHAWSILVRYFPGEVTAKDESELRALLKNSALRPEDSQLLRGAIAKLEQRQGNHEAAFKAILSAKPSQGEVSYSPDFLSEHVDQLIGEYSTELFDRFRGAGSNSDAPIFIVGLPRSGTTLVERILGGHSKIEAIGEVPILPHLVAAEQADGIARYRSVRADTLTAQKLTDMSAWYLERSNEFRHTDKPHFIDKYNGNWIRAGLIMLMFPNAKILDVRRDALDCCWSVFSNFFADDYAQDQRHLARYYADYVRFMDATAAARPNGILTVDYEALVDDVEGQTRKMLEFLGLDFERACVDFHLSKAPVSTPSSEQVRRPLNREGIGSAEPYKPWLQPLIDELRTRLGDRA